MAKVKRKKQKWRIFLTTMWKAFGKYKKNMITLTGLGFLAGLFEGIGINAFVPLLSMLFDLEYERDAISMMIVKLFDVSHITLTLPTLLIFIILLFVGKSIVLLIFEYISTKIIAGYERTTRLDLLKSTLKARWSYLVEQKVGYLETMLLTDVRQSAILLQTIVGAIMRVSVAAVYIVVAVNINATITCISLVFGIGLTILVKPLVRKTKNISAKITRLNKKIAHYISQVVSGMKSVKVITEVRPVAEGGDVHFRDLLKQKVRLTLVRYGAGMLIEPFAIIFISVYLLFSYQDSRFELTSFLVVMYLVYKIFMYIKQIQGSVYKITTMFPYLQAVLAYQEEGDRSAEDTTGNTPFAFRDTLAFSGVHFSYPLRNEKVLHNINFEIQKGEMVGIIGPSGSGKTTIVDLILRLLTPSDGAITVDGTDINTIDLRAWRDHIGYVPQEVFLLNGTIADNVRFFDDTIDGAAIDTAIEEAGLGEFVASLADGKETMVGERGLRMSAGQRQRIHVARVMARRPSVLILDEATSALDKESEKHIESVLEGLKGKVTMIVIAHRLSTIMNCNTLYVLKGGSILEQGTPSELLKAPTSYFAQMHRLDS